TSAPVEGRSGSGRSVGNRRRRRSDMTAVDRETRDRYPTRVATGSEFLRRGDPVVWPGRDDGPASPQELARHERDGFHVVPDLLAAAELRRFRAELDRLASDPAVRADERTVVEPASDEVRSIFDVHRTSGPVAELVRDERMLDRARQLLGSEV